MRYFLVFVSRTSSKITLHGRRGTFLVPNSLSEEPSDNLCLTDLTQSQNNGATLHGLFIVRWVPVFRNPN